MSKYRRLSSNLAARTEDEVTLEFSKIADILGFALPESAFKYPAWWANQEGKGHTQSASWQSAGWRTQGLDLGARRVTFFRESRKSPSKAPPLTPSPTQRLTIEQAKSGLAAHFGVKPESIEITIRG